MCRMWGKRGEASGITALRALDKLNGLDVLAGCGGRRVSCVIYAVWALHPYSVLLLTEWTLISQYTLIQVFVACWANPQAGFPRRAAQPLFLSVSGWQSHGPSLRLAPHVAHNPAQSSTIRRLEGQSHQQSLANRFGQVELVV